jgi:PDZ domain
LIAVQADVVLPAGDTLGGWFFFDSGAGLYLTFNTPLVAEHGLRHRIGKTYKRTGRALTARESIAVGGRVAGVRFCGQSFPADELARDTGGLPVWLSQSGEGVQAFASHAGFLGNGILKRYNTAIDLVRRRLWLRPNGLANEPLRVDGSGIALKAVREQRIVDRVVKGSPAAVAGVASGDELVRLDGMLASGMTLQEVREHLQALGTTVELRLRRGGSLRSVHLALCLLYSD